MSSPYDNKALVHTVQKDLADKYKYKALPPMFSVETRAFYKDTLPERFLEQGDNQPLFSSEGTLLCNKYNRIVIGDYGAFVEILPEDMVCENLKIKAGQEYRVNDERYSKNVKYSWLTAKDGSDVKIYHQKKTVDYADYVPGRYYICPFECFFEIGFLRNQLVVEDPPKPKYAIKCVTPQGYSEYIYYVACGGTYQVQGEKYVCITTNINEAKLYKSAKLAELAYSKLFESCVNLASEYEIVEIL